MAKTEFKVTEGDDKDNTLNGTEENDIVRGKNGNDTLSGGGNNGLAVVVQKDGKTDVFGIFGQDFLTGGAGADTFRRQKSEKGIAIITDFEAENDKFESDVERKDWKTVDTKFGAFAYYGEMRFDVLSDNGVLFLNTKKETLDKYLKGDFEIKEQKGGDGADKFYGSERRDKLLGNGGNDELFGKEGNDELDGGAGTDLLDGGAGDDRMVGGQDGALAALVRSSGGANTLFFSVSADKLKGGEGKDTFVHNKGDGIDIIEDFNGDFFETNLGANDFTVVDTNRGAFAYYDKGDKFGESIDLYSNGALFTGVKADDVKKRLAEQGKEKEKMVSERDAALGNQVQQLLQQIVGADGNASGERGTTIEQSLSDGLASLA
jgi:Ca2+-binding RTX toxin-like protein